MVYETRTKLKLHEDYYVLEEPEVLYAIDFDAITASCMKPTEPNRIIAIPNVIANKTAEVDLNKKEIMLLNDEIYMTNKEMNNDVTYITTRNIGDAAMDILEKTISTIYGVSIKASIILREFKVEDGKVTSIRVNEYSRVHLYLRKPGYVRKCVPQSVLEGLHVRFLYGDYNSIPIDLHARDYEENLQKLKEETRRVIRLVKAADIDSDYEGEIINALSDLEFAIMRQVESTVARIANESWKVTGGGQRK